MPSLRFEEMLLLFPDHTHESVQFKFDVVGGNPRFIGGLKSRTVRGARFYDVVECAVKWMFGAEYVPKDVECHSQKEELGIWAICTLVEILTSALRDSSPNKCRTDSSVFMEYIVSQNYSAYEEQYSSVFLGHLSEKLQKSFEGSILSRLHELFGASGMGNAFEYISHAQLVETDEMHWCLSSSGDCCQLALGNRRKKLIRNIGDIGNIHDGDYGLPTICNFPILDAILPPNIGLQMTIGSSHRGSVRRLPEILAMLNLSAADFTIVFIVPEDVLAHFNFPRNLGEVNLYVTVPSAFSEDAFRKLRLTRKYRDDDSVH